MDRKRRKVTLDDDLKEWGMYEEVTQKAIANTIAWLLSEHIKETHKSKKALAEELNTSRSQLDRLLDPEKGYKDIKIGTLLSIGRITGKKLRVEFA